MKKRCKQYFLMICIFIITAFCCSVVAFANKGKDEDIVDMGDLTKLTTTDTHKEETVASPKRGDVNKDGHINIQDLVLLKKCLAQFKDITISEELGDFNRNGRIDVADAVILGKHLAGFNIDLDNIATPIEPTTQVATPIEPTTKAIATPIEPTTPVIATPIEPTIEQSTTHPDPDGPGWSDWIKPALNILDGR